jgi:hypothetical protein
MPSPVGLSFMNVDGGYPRRRRRAFFQIWQSLDESRNTNQWAVSDEPFDLGMIQYFRS